jgi:hypothetical protein
VVDSRRHRQKQNGRKPPFRNQAPTILIVSEGLTEEEYFKGFWNACHNPRVTIKVIGRSGTPKKVVEVAKEKRDEAAARAGQENDDNIGFDSVWCVYDVDDHPHHHEAREMADVNDIKIAILNPCFELWLLLHFRENLGEEDRDAIQSLLKQHYADYDKHVDYELCSQGYEQAVIRAKKLDRLASQISQAARNPTTGVYKLTELIRGTCPPIHGAWWVGMEVETREMMIVLQNGNLITADCYLHGIIDREIRWRLRGTISVDGGITGYLEYPASEGDLRYQNFAGRLSQDENTIEGRAVFDDGGGNDHIWTRII